MRTRAQIEAAVQGKASDADLVIIELLLDLRGLTVMMNQRLSRLGSTPSE